MTGQQYTYDAYGNVVEAGFGITPGTSSEALTNLQYSGEWTNTSTGLQYLRARWYDPTPGVFNRLDPFAGDPRNPVSLNKYQYTHGNPVMGIDPTGLSVTQGTGNFGGLASGSVFDGSSYADEARKLLDSFAVNPTGDILGDAWLSSPISHAPPALPGVDHAGLQTTLTPSSAVDNINSLGYQGLATGVDALLSATDEQWVEIDASLRDPSDVFWPALRDYFFIGVEQRIVDRAPSPSEIPRAIKDSIEGVLREPVLTIGAATGVIDFEYAHQNSILVRQINEANARGDNAHGLAVDIVADAGLAITGGTAQFWGDLTSGDPDRQGDALRGSSDVLFNLALQRKLDGRGSAPKKAVQNLTGQEHHAISKKVHSALEAHPNLKGHYQARDPRLTAQAKDLPSHRGYQRWHRSLDTEVSNWIRRNPNATPADFESYLRHRYSQPDLMDRFPNGLGGAE